MAMFIARDREERKRAARLNRLFSKIPAADSLLPVPGNGCLRPKVALVFINPTYRNVSTSPSWKGARFPFVGTKQLWKVLFKAGWLPGALWERIGEGWTEELSFSVLRWMVENGIWLTNVVKTAYSHSNIPGREEIREGMEMLANEVGILKPEFIISMGLVPFKAMTGLSPRLGDIYRDVMAGNVGEWEFMGSMLLPCYFPVGRGNPGRAVEMLAAYSERFKFFHKK